MTMINEKARTDECRRRVQLINKLMEENGLDAVLMTSAAQQTMQLCVKFFSDYMLSSRRAYIFCEKGGVPYLILPTAGQQFHARMGSWLPSDHILCGDMLAIIDEKLAGHKKVGWYQPDEIPVGVYRHLTAGDIEWVDINRKLTVARASKSDYEIELTKDASKLAADSFTMYLSILKGVTERIIGAAEDISCTRGIDSLLLTRSQKPHSFITRAQLSRLMKGRICYQWRLPDAAVIGRSLYAPCS